MKVLAICCLVLGLLFATCGNGFSNPAEKAKDLEGKMAILESMFVQTMGELQQTVQDAKPIFAAAEKILKAKKSGFTWEEKSKINLAAFYEQRIEYLKVLIKLIILESVVTEKELNIAKGQREA